MFHRRNSADHPPSLDRTLPSLPVKIGHDILSRNLSDPTILDEATLATLDGVVQYAQNNRYKVFDDRFVRAIVDNYRQVYVPCEAALRSEAPRGHGCSIVEAAGTFTHMFSEVLLACPGENNKRSLLVSSIRDALEKEIVDQNELSLFNEMFVGVRYEVGYQLAMQKMMGLKGCMIANVRGASIREDIHEGFDVELTMASGKKCFIDTKSSGSFDGCVERGNAVPIAPPDNTMIAKNLPPQKSRRIALNNRKFVLREGTKYPIVIIDAQTVGENTGYTHDGSRASKSGKFDLNERDLYWATLAGYAACAEK